MTGFLISSVLIFCFGAFLTCKTIDGHSNREILTSTFGAIFSLAGLIGLVFYGLMIWEWTAAEHKLNIIEREYDAKYSQAEIYYAEDVVDIIQKLHRSRAELTVNYQCKE